MQSILEELKNKYVRKGDLPGDATGKSCLELCLRILCNIGSTFSWPLTIMVLWNWFMVPLGVVPIHYWWAFGLSSLIACFYARTSLLTYNNTPQEDITLCAAAMLMGAWLTIAICYPVHLYGM